MNNRLMGEVEEIPIKIRNGLNPGDVGRLITMHGEIYYKECGYNDVFEGYVCKTFFEAMVKEQKEKDCFWIVESQDKIVGSVAVISKSEKVAQLRWLLLDKNFRGNGIGKKLISEAINFAKNKQYEKIFLETTYDQKAAIAMYERAGFAGVGTYKISEWGRELTGFVMEMNLEKSEIKKTGRNFNEEIVKKQ